jgi:CRISPR system Cascade subunit CasB
MSDYSYSQRLETLSDGQRASLKRCAGRLLREADARALSAFYSVLSRKESTWREELIFAALCMACLWRREDVQAPKPFISCLLNVASGEQSESLDNRLRELLDTAYHETDFLSIKLYRLVRRLRAEGERPDFDALTGDLLRWNHPDKYIQLKWAREYFGRGTKETTEETDEEESNDAV